LLVHHYLTLANQAGYDFPHASSPPYCYQGASSPHLAGSARNQGEDAPL
jgi:hypothetical protein